MLDKSPETADDLIARMGAAAREAAQVLATAGSESKYAALIGACLLYTSDAADE